MRAPNPPRSKRARLAAAGVALTVTAIGLVATASSASAACGKWQSDTLQAYSDTFRSYVSYSMTVSNSGTCRDVNVRLNSGYKSTYLQAWVLARTKVNGSWSAGTVKGTWVHTDHNYHVVFPRLKNGTTFRIEVPKEYGNKVNVTVMT